MPILFPVHSFSIVGLGSIAGPLTARRSPFPTWRRRRRGASPRRRGELLRPHLLPHAPATRRTSPPAASTSRVRSGRARRATACSSWSPTCRRWKQLNCMTAPPRSTMGVRWLGDHHQPN
ncbi:hypothetical protein DAI22_11g206700 [Oryza sativa Japonica Group]|nr:hypothetical protein DAI22_11g206700 [Oryza sativa Japonica Group]